MLLNFLLIFYVCNNDGLVFGLLDEVNELSVSARARKQRDGEMASAWRAWESGIASEVEGQTFF